MVKKVSEYLYLFRHNWQTWRTDGQTDKHCTMANTALCTALHGNNVSDTYLDNGHQSVVDFVCCWAEI